MKEQNLLKQSCEHGSRQCRDFHSPSPGYPVRPSSVAVQLQRVEERRRFTLRAL